MGKLKYGFITSLLFAPAISWGHCNFFQAETSQPRRVRSAGAEMVGISPAEIQSGAQPLFLKLRDIHERGTTYRSDELTVQMLEELERNAAGTPVVPGKRSGSALGAAFRVGITRISQYLGFSLSMEVDTRKAVTNRLDRRLVHAREDPVKSQRLFEEEFSKLTSRFLANLKKYAEFRDVYLEIYEYMYSHEKAKNKKAVLSLHDEIKKPVPNSPLEIIGQLNRVLTAITHIEAENRDQRNRGNPPPADAFLIDSHLAALHSQLNGLRNAIKQFSQKMADLRERKAILSTHRRNILAFEQGDVQAKSLREVDVKIAHINLEINIVRKWLLLERRLEEYNRSWVELETQAEICETLEGIRARQLSEMHLVWEIPELKLLENELAENYRIFTDPQVFGKWYTAEDNRIPFLGGDIRPGARVLQLVERWRYLHSVRRAALAAEVNREWLILASYPIVRNILSRTLSLPNLIRVIKRAVSWFSAKRAISGALKIMAPKIEELETAESDAKKDIEKILSKRMMLMDKGTEPLKDDALVRKVVAQLRILKKLPEETQLSNDQYREKLLKAFTIVRNYVRDRTRAGERHHDEVRDELRDWAMVTAANWMKARSLEDGESRLPLDETVYRAILGQHFYEREPLTNPESDLVGVTVTYGISTVAAAASLAWVFIF